MHVRKLAALAALTLTATACSTGGTAIPAGAPMDGDGDIVPTSSATDETIKKFGETATFPDGVAVQVTAPEAFDLTTEETERQIYEQTGPTARFSVTVTNGSNQPVNLNGFTLKVTDEDKEAREIRLALRPTSFEDQPDVSVLPGKSVTWRAGWYISSPAKTTVQLESFQHSVLTSVFFTN